MITDGLYARAYLGVATFPDDLTFIGVFIGPLKVVVRILNSSRDPEVEPQTD